MSGHTEIAKLLMMSGLIASILLTLLLQLEECMRKHWRQ
jgi:hypothetical protein